MQIFGGGDRLVTSYILSGSTTYSASHLDGPFAYDTTVALNPAAELGEIVQCSSVLELIFC